MYERSPLLSLQPIEDFYGRPLKSTFNWFSTFKGGQFFSFPPFSS